MSNDPIIEDIFENRRLFLPGTACQPDEVRAHFDSNILLDGLTREESQLVLSTLPKDSHRIYLSPLDKGLSGSKVFSGRYEMDGRPISKPFVFKIGEIKKIDDEQDAIEKLVRPHIQGIVNPIYRRGSSRGLIIQELAGLSARSSLESLKEHVRSSGKAEETIQRLFGDRLNNWYQAERALPKLHEIGKLFTWYLTKVTSDDPIPEGWSELSGWVKDQTGLVCGDIGNVINIIKSQSVTTLASIVHGDLHSQNILIDERGECWPIDFAWCHAEASPLLDFTMLECSLKFLAFPRRSALRSLIAIEHALAREPLPDITVGPVPYNVEICNVLRGVLAIRQFAFQEIGIAFADYRKALCMMTYVHSTHPLLNRPLVLASLQILCALEKGEF